jgi:hypothetical protein
MWWTDHAEFYSGHYSKFVVTPSGPTQARPSFWTLGTWGPGNLGVAALDLRGVPGTVRFVSGRVIAMLPPGDSEAVDTVDLSFGLLKQGGVKRSAFGLLARPLVSDPRFRFVVWRDPSTARFPRVDVTVPLAWHPRGVDGFREVLHYRFDSALASATSRVGDTMETLVPWPSGDSATVELSPLADAAGLPDGLDNTTDQYAVRFLVHRRSSDSVPVTFTLPTIANQVSGALSQMEPAVQLAHAAGASYGTRVMFGIEVALNAPALAGTAWDSVSGGGRHLAVYLPGDISSELEDSTGGGVSLSFGARVEGLGGILSIAHPFGTSTTLPTLSPSARQQVVKQLGAFLVNNGAWGARLIEVGYNLRGGFVAYDHMALLDYLLANGLTICGVGVTDSHGGRLIADPPFGTEDQYNFVTWIGDVDRASPATDIVAALRRCDVSFGNVFYTRGGMWLGVETDSTGDQVLRLDLDGVSPSAQFYVYDVEIDSTGVPHDPVYRALGQLVPRDGRLIVGGCRRGYARMEAWFGTRPLAFSNVVPLAPEPAKCGLAAPDTPPGKTKSH